MRVLFRLLPAIGIVVSVRTGATQQSLVPSPRAGHVLVTAGDAGGVLLAQGQLGYRSAHDEPRLSDTLWAWNGAHWRVISTDGPHNRTLPAAAFDVRRNVLVVFGGSSVYSGTFYGDTWEWDGQRWTEQNVRTPGARDHHAMAYDAARGNMVTFGGQMQSGPILTFSKETWTWDGRRWTMADSATGPSGLVHHAMAYDARRQRVVLYGGATADRHAAGDTWEWDGARWTRVATDGPGPRVGHRMAYDPARGVTVLFGGASDSTTWTWDGKTWVRYAVDAPAPRSVHAMAYDARKGRVVLFGGSSGGEHLSDLWEWDGQHWHEITP
jgi:hypothetical protein